MSLGNAEMYKYGRNRSPDLRVDPLGGSSKRACFYQACTKYEKRFKCKPPEPLYDQLWLMAEQKWYDNQ